MFSFLALLDLDPDDWRVIDETPERAITELNRWIGRARVDDYFFWPNEDERTISIFGVGRSSRSAATTQRTLEELLRTVPFGRFVGVEVTPLTSEDWLNESRLSVIAAFSGPGSRCPGCGAAEPPHLPGCPWYR